MLVIHFKQLSLHPLTGEPVLLRKSVDFPLELTVNLRFSERKYQLTSLLTHMGNESMGHYFTFRKMDKDGSQWYMISDNLSKPCGSGYLKVNVPYMLFYECE